MDSLKENGKQKITSAIQFEKQNSLTSAIMNYEEGIQYFEALLNPHFSLSKDFHSALNTNIIKYKAKLKSLNEKLNQALNSSQYKECLNIEAGTQNVGYIRLFKRFFNPYSVSEIQISDPDIQSKAQIENLVHFCEMAVKLSNNQLKKISVTTKSTNHPDQRTMFSQLTKSLRFQDITLVYQLVDEDDIKRNIQFNNGWDVNISLGLNYLEFPNEYSPGISSFELRSSYLTQIEMTYAKIEIL